MPAEKDLKKHLDAVRRPPAPPAPPPEPGTAGFAFLGAGQGGGKIARAFWDLGYRRVGVFNTTAADFQGLPEEMRRLSLETGGAGKDMARADADLKSRIEDVRDLLTRAWGRDAAWGMVAACLGGGTGSGTAARLAQLARNYLEDQRQEPRVGAVISLPSLKDQQPARNTVLAFQALLQARVSPLIVMDNARISQLYQTSMFRLHGHANALIASLLFAFDHYASVHSEITSFDRSELVQLLSGGICALGQDTLPLERIKSPADVSSAVRDQLTRSVLAGCDLTRGKKAGLLFVGSERVLDALGSEYFEAGVQALDRVLGQGAPERQQTVIHSGIYCADDDGDDVLKLYALVSGLEPPYDRLNELARAGGIDKAVVPGLASYLGVAD